MTPLLDHDRLAAIARDAGAFRERRPYPWASLQGVLRKESYEQLRTELPPQDLFTPEFGKARAYGQQSHDRYALQYRPSLHPALAPSWQALLAELQSEPYLGFLRAMYGLGPGERFVLTMHWHHAPAGASVSPHTDARRKIGSHIFYFNGADDWDDAWGGQTLVLDDAGRRSRRDAPAFGELPVAGASQILGNHSFMFRCTEHSWHAVNPIACPPGKLRKVFIVVASRIDFQVWWRKVRGKDADGYRL